MNLSPSSHQYSSTCTTIASIVFALVFAIVLRLLMFQKRAMTVKVTVKVMRVHRV